MFIRIAPQALLLILAAFATTAHGADYGLDCSFPIHSLDLSCGDLLGDRKQFYEDFMTGCRKYYGKKGNRCDQTEEGRLEMSKRQPQSMVRCKSATYGTPIFMPKIAHPPGYLLLLSSLVVR
jgi:hypothetical protein